MRQLATIMIVALLAVTASANGWSASILGGTDSTAAIGIGRTFDGSEFGLSIVTADETPGGIRSAMGPYVGTQAVVPGLDAQDAVSFLGGAFLVDMETSKPVYRGFAGLILNPQSQASPVVLYNYSYATTDVLPVDRSTVYAGLRIRF